MLKDAAISVLGALLAMEWVPWAEELGAWEKASVGAGWTCALIIFCLFCDRCGERWRRYRGRVSRIKSEVDRLAGAGGNGRSAGKGEGR